jgi:hypothetical protein
VKTGNDGRCGRVVFVAPSTSRLYTALELPTIPVNWALESAFELGCAMSALESDAIGAIGTLKLREAAGGCVADAHLTAFFERDDGVVAVRFDADGLTLAGMSPGFCQ